MLNKACSAISLSLLLLGAPLSVLAQERFYAGLGLGLSHVDPEENNTGYEVDDSRDFAWKLTLGYEVSDRLSLELLYADLGEATLKPQGSIEYQIFGVSGRYSFYHEDGPTGFASHQGFSLYGKLGVGKMNNEGENITYHRVHDVHILYGVGAEYGMGEDLSVNLEAEFYDKDAALFSVNLIRRF